MKPVHRMVALIGLGVAALVVGLIVLIRNWTDLDVDLLAAVAVVGGVAMVVTALPSSNGNGH
jgi:hypothetical protein